MLPLVILSFTRLTLLYFSLKLISNLGFTWLNLVDVSISSETICNPQFNLVQLGYFSVNSSVIFTQLILGLCSLKSGYHSIKSNLSTLRVFKTFLLISLVITG